MSLSLERNRYYHAHADNYTVAVAWLLPVQRLKKMRLRYADQEAD